MKLAWHNPLARHCPTASGQSLLMILLIVGVTAMLLTTVYQGVIHRRLRNIQHVRPQPITFAIDINHADWPELTLIPGIGKTLAQRIVAYRDQHGPFDGSQELLAVHGVGPKLLSYMKPYLIVRAAVDEADADEAAGREVQAGALAGDFGDI